MLNGTWGLPQQYPNVIDNIEEPTFLSVDGSMFRKSSTRCPLLPQESYNDHDQHSLGIWAHMVRFANLWSDVRTYITSCMDPNALAPWQPSSLYTVINGRMLDMECDFPPFYRYDSARFMDRSQEEIAAKRDYWLPWMRVQISYHALQCLLNHPFIYSSKLKRKSSHNAFWKVSSEQALLHSTWIARVIDSATQKNLELSDPFFAYAAAVAATLHFYWTCATDLKVRASAEKNLLICKTLITKMKSRWEICRALVGHPCFEHAPLN